METTYFLGIRGIADFVFMLLFGGLTMIIFAWFWTGIPFLGSSMVFMVLYSFCRKNPDHDELLWMFRFKAWHFPFVLLALGVLLGGSPLLDILGILVGHLYYFVTDVVPIRYRIQLIKTPEFLYRLFEQGTLRPAAPSWQRGGYRLQ